MKYRLSCILMPILIVVILSCTVIHKEHSLEKEISFLFLNSAKKEDFNSLYKILMPSKMTEDTFRFRRTIKTIRFYDSIYTISNMDRWDITADTLEYLKFTIVNIPVYKAKSDSLKIAEIKLFFDASKHGFLILL